jgi:hypothetical protein
MVNTLQVPISKLLRQTLTLRKVTKSPTGSRWGTTTESTTDYVIKGRLSSVNTLDLVALRMGNISSGDARAFVRPSYDINGTTVIAEVGDYIIFNGVKWRITIVFDEYDRYGRSVYRRCDLERTSD